MMAEHDKDIEDLERLLGPVAADYRSLRHKGALQEHQLKPRRIGSVRVAAIAASVVLAVTAVTFLASGPGRHVDPKVVSKMTIPASFPSRPAGRWTAKEQPRRTLSLARLSVSPTLPRRPGRSTE